MKKTMLSTALALVTFGVIAQETGGMTSKKGEAILPEADDWALCIDAVPLMYYLGNLANGNLNNPSPSWNYPGTPLAITIKMFKDEKTAYRAMIRLGFGSAKRNNFVDDDTNVDPAIVVNDSWKTSYNNIVLGGGLEFRRGKTRLQGFYGGMLVFGMGGSKNTYSYGNAYSATQQNPTSTTAWTPTITVGPAVSRPTESKAGSSFMVALRGFIGAEYFIFPKMAIGAEFGWGLGLSSTGEEEKTRESWDATTSAVKPTTIKTGKSSEFGIDTDINGTQMIPTGSLTLALHF